MANGPAVLAGYGCTAYRSQGCTRDTGGDLQVISMDGYGTDAYLHLNRLGERAGPCRDAGRLVERRARARDTSIFSNQNRFEDPASPPNRRRVVVHPSRRVTRGRCAGWARVPCSGGRAPPRRPHPPPRSSASPLIQKRRRRRAPTTRGGTPPPPWRRPRPAPNPTSPSPPSNTPQERFAADEFLGRPGAPRRGLVRAAAARAARPAATARISDVGRGATRPRRGPPRRECGVDRRAAASPPRHRVGRRSPSRCERCRRVGFDEASDRRCLSNPRRRDRSRRVLCTDSGADAATR